MIGMILQQQGRPDEAKKAYERALSIDRLAPIAANNLAWLHAETGGNLDVALDLAQRAKQAQPASPDVDDTLGWVFYKKKLPAFAIPPLKRAVESNPRNGVYQFHLGLALLDAGPENAAAARLALEKALKLGGLDEKSAAQARKELQGLAGS
jgi:tetratricopeptide (TPR) repeat protein